MIKKLLPSSDFSKNVLTLAAGTTLAQVIPIAISPILSRLYSPADFGAFSIFIAISTIIGSIATLRYEMAIVLPKNNDDAVNILAISLMLTCIISALVLATLCLFYNTLSPWIYKENEVNYLYLIPLSVLSLGIYQAFNFWSIRNKSFKANAFSRVSQTSTNSIVSITLGVIQKGALGLIVGQITGQLIAAITLVLKTVKEHKTYSTIITKKSLKENFVQYRHHSIVNSSHVLLDALLNYGISFVLLFFFTNTIVGFYAFSFRILKAPLSILGAAMGQVFYQQASELYSKQLSIQKTILNIYKKQLMIGFIPFLTLFLFAPQIFSFFFGEQWTEAGRITQIILPWIFLNFLVSPVSTITIVVNKQKQALLLTVIDSLLKLIAIGIGSYYNSYIIAFVLMSIGGSLLMIVDLIWYYRIAAYKTESIKNVF